VKPAALLPLALVVASGCGPKQDPLIGIWLQDDNKFSRGISPQPETGAFVSSFREYRRDGTWLFVIHDQFAAAERYVVFRGNWERKNNTLTIEETSGTAVVVRGDSYDNSRPPEPTTQTIKSLTADRLEIEAKGATATYIRGTEYPSDMNPAAWPP
jgi:hypothetical protein